jgi:tetratricopeptide (TPR) repeat protein
MRGWGIALAAALAGVSQAADVRDAIAAMQRGDYAAAEQQLRAEVAAHPGEAPALSLLAVALDNENKLPEAASFHRRALAAAPNSADVLGNYGNHLVLSGDDEGAQQAYLKVVAIDSANSGANLQLARLALKRKDAAEARRYLSRVPDAALADPRLCFSLAAAFANAGEFADAEAWFGRVLAATPAEFNVLYNLGAVANAAGHFERAREVLETALRQQPDSVDVLYRLAEANHGLRRYEAALSLLARAAKLAPQRADIQKLLAVTAADLGAAEDALAAWDHYLSLAPDDALAHRERAVAALHVGHTAEGMAELAEYLKQHPDDAVAHFQVGLAQAQSDSGAALAELDRAISLRPDWSAAHSARGNLFYQQGKPEAALPDLEMADKSQSDDATTLDRLGQTYLALDRPGDAVRVLRRAAALAPDDPTVQLHFGRALGQAGDAAEAKTVMEHFRQLGPANKRGIPAGLVAYLAMSPAERRADYRARVEKAVRESPADAAAQLDYLELLLDDGKLPEAAETARKLAALRPQPSPALAIAQARLLEATGKPDDAVAALAAAPQTPEIAWRETALLLRLKRPQDALRALDRATASDEVTLLKTAILKITGQTSESDRILADMRRRRPEWPALQTLRTKTPAEIASLLQQKPPSEW